MKNQAQQYLQNQILTAPREQLLLMLFDGAIRFAEQAKPKIDEKDFEGSCKLLIKAQRIVIELMSSLKRELLGDEVFDNLMALYNFIYFRLVNANVKKDKGLVDEAVRILSHLRETWSMAIEKDRKEKFPQLALMEKARKESTPAPAAPPRGPLNIEG